MSDNPLPDAKPITRYAPDMPLPTAAAPALSIVVVAYAMPEQLDRTLHSLSLNYQRGVAAQDYEVIVVENASAENLGEPRATSHTGDFRYYQRQETAPTPIHAINFGVAQAKYGHVCIMIDGARMVTPGLVAWTRAALSMHSRAVVSVPGYHLGEELQQVAVDKGYNEAAEAALLEHIHWPKDGYRLFEISCAAGTSAGGYFKPIGESNCIAMSRALFDELGGYDTQFQERGGGLVNLDFYKRSLEAADTQLYLLPGEGSFHQFHGGETTGGAAEVREQALHAMQAEYVALRGERYSPPEQRAVFLGAIPDSALWVVRRAAETFQRVNPSAHQSEAD